MTGIWAAIAMVSHTAKPLIKSVHIHDDLRIMIRLLYYSVYI